MMVGPVIGPTESRGNGGKQMGGGATGAGTSTSSSRVVHRNPARPRDCAHSGARIARAISLFVTLTLTTMMAALAQPRILEVTPQAVTAAPDLRAGDVLLGARWSGGEQRFDSSASALQFQWQTLPLGGVSVEIERDGQRLWRPWAPMSMELSLAAPESGDSVSAELDRALQTLNVARFKPNAAAEDQAWEAAWTLVSTRPELAPWRALVALLGAKAALARSSFDVGLKRANLLDAAIVDPVLRSALVETRFRALMGLRNIPALAALLDGAGLDLSGARVVHAGDAQLLVRTAWLRVQQGQFEEALRLARLGHVALSALCADCLDTVAALDVQALVLARLDQPAAAYEQQLQVHRVWQSLQPRAERTAISALKLAGYAARAGKQAEALELATSASQLLTDIDAPPYQRGAAANVLGVQLFAVGRVDEAERSFRAALQELGDAPQEAVLRAQIQNNLGLMLKQHGQLAAAYAALVGSASDYQAQKLDKGAEFASVAGNLANMERLRGDLTAAGEWLDRSLVALGSASAPGPRKVATLIDMAALSAQLGRPDEARERLAAAQDAAAQTPAECPCRPLADLHQGTALVKTNSDEALRLLDRAARVFERDGMTLDLARAESASAQAYAAKGDIKPARNHMSHAAQRWRSSFPDSIEYAQTLHQLGRIEAQAGQASAARKAYCEATGVLDHASFSLGADDFNQMRFRSQFVEVYRDCMLTTLDAQGAAAALDVLLRTRQIAWQQGLRQRALASADPALVALLATNRRDYDDAYQSLNRQGATEAERSRALDKVVELRRARELLQSKLVDIAPAQALAATDLVALVGSDEIMLVYALGESRNQVFVLRSGRPVKSVALSLDRQQLRAAVAQWRDLVARRRMQDLPEIRRLGGLLYQQLLGPLEAELRDHRRLVIIPDDVLHQLPFAALWDGQVGEYLVERMSIRLADGLAAADGASTDVDGRWLAMADAALEGIKSAPDLAWMRAGAAPLAALPGARREVEALSALRRDTEMYLGAQASESTLKSAAATADVLHLAVHTALDPANPMESALVLAPGGDENGLLQVWEVLEQMHLRASLVVLSGCETGVGAQLDGEGVMGFVRAFHRAGARSVVASLWPTHDAATAELVQRFYRARLSTKSEADALRSAMQALLGEAPAVASGGERGVGGLTGKVPVAALNHPWYWASLQVHADE